MPFLKDNPNRWTIRSILGSLTIAAMGIAPFLSGMGSSTHTAQRGEDGKPEICVGHTKNVKMTDTATDRQCREYLEADITEAISYVVQNTPGILEQRPVIEAASHYTLSSGTASYYHSPMRMFFLEEEWVKGCRAFKDYNIHYNYKIRPLGKDCVKLPDGVWTCVEPGLIKERQDEMNMCLRQ